MKFEISGNSLVKLNIWKKSHECKKQYQGAIAYEREYTFSPNSVGMNIEVRCLHCGEKKDLTDYNDW